MTRSRLGSNIGCLVVAVLFLALVGVVWGYMSEPSEKPNILHTTTPIVTATMRPTRTNEPTTTPAPNYHGTQVSLDNAIATHQAGIDEQMRKATGTAEALAIEHQATVYSVDVSIAQTRLSGAIDDYEYGVLLHTIGISQAAVMAQDEINQEARYRDGSNNIKLAWQAAWRFLAFLAGLLFILSVAWKVHSASKDDRELSVAERIAEHREKIDMIRDEEAMKQKSARNAEIMAFVLDGLDLVDDTSTKIPSAAMFKDAGKKYEGRLWQEPVNIMKADGYVMTTNQGTELKGGLTIGMVLEELRAGVYPLPHIRARQQWHNITL